MMSSFTMSEAFNSENTSKSFSQYHDLSDFYLNEFCEEESNVLQICRLCLNEVDEVVSLFAKNTSDGEVLLYADMVVECASVKVYKTDKLPKVICLECVKRLNYSYEFRKLCQKSERTLQNLIPKFEEEDDFEDEDESEVDIGSDDGEVSQDNNNDNNDDNVIKTDYPYDIEENFSISESRLLSPKSNIDDLLNEAEEISVGEDGPEENNDNNKDNDIKTDYPFDIEENFSISVISPKSNLDDLLNQAEAISDDEEESEVNNNNNNKDNDIKTDYPIDIDDNFSIPESRLLSPKSNIDDLLNQAETITDDEEEFEDNHNNKDNDLKTDYPFDIEENFSISVISPKSNLDDLLNQAEAISDGEIEAEDNNNKTNDIRTDYSIDIDDNFSIPENTLISPQSNLSDLLNQTEATCIDEDEPEENTNNNNKVQVIRTDYSIGIEKNFLISESTLISSKSNLLNQTEAICIDEDEPKEKTNNNNKDITTDYPINIEETFLISENTLISSKSNLLNQTEAISIDENEPEENTNNNNKDITADYSIDIDDNFSISEDALISPKSNITDLLNQTEAICIDDDYDESEEIITNNKKDNVVEAGYPINIEENFPVSENEPISENEPTPENEPISPKSNFTDFLNQLEDISEDDIESAKPEFLIDINTSDLIVSALTPNPTNVSNTLEDNSIQQTNKAEESVVEYICNICKAVFFSYDLLNKHLSEMHPNIKLHNCTKCLRKFSSSTDLQKHLLIHDEKRSCEICGKILSSYYNLKAHLKNHIGHKDYICDTCGKGFSLIANLHNHQKTHTEDKPYKCEHCGKSFLFIAFLKSHLKNIHLGEKSYICKYCEKVHTNYYHLKLHERTHTGDKPYVCKTCGKSFVVKSSLNKHEKIHAGRYAAKMFNSQQN